MLIYIQKGDFKMKAISYVIIGLLYFYTAYRSFIGNVYGKISTVIDTILIFFIAVSTFLAKSNVEYIICLIGGILIFIFEVADCIIYYKKGISACLHTKKVAYITVILCCIITLILSVATQL